MGERRMNILIEEYHMTLYGSKLSDFLQNYDIVYKQKKTKKLHINCLLPPTALRPLSRRLRDYPLLKACNMLTYEGSSRKQGKTQEKRT
jgi:hypothetical protein